MSFHDQLPPESRPPINPVLLPTQALILYGNRVMLKHAVQQTQGTFSLGPGAHLSAKDVQTLISTLGAQGVTLTQANTLAVSSAGLHWHCPAHQRAVLYSAKYQETSSISALSGVSVPHPSLVFVARTNQLRVFAVRGHDRPTPDTPLFHAPYWNTFSNGGVCRGSVRYPSSLLPRDQAAWEHAFFHSEFTGPSRQDKYINWDASFEELQRHLLQLGHFPDELLLPAQLTLNDIL